MGNKTSDVPEINDDEETIADSFVCCVCLDLLYKPIVLGCGHVSCFWCVHKSMDGLRESHCPICRNPYHYFPTICELLHFLLLKMYPVPYKRREKQILEEEKQQGCFSPELDVKEQNSVGEPKVSHGADNTLSSRPASPCHVGEYKNSLKLSSNSSTAIEENSSSATNYGVTFGEPSITDVLCPACSQVLFHPAVLNCGHVYCESCIILPEDGIIICKVCESPHPTNFPKVCFELNNFLEEKFSEEYAARRESVEQLQTQFQCKKSDADSSLNDSSKKGVPKSCRTGEDLLPWWHEHGSKVHIGVGCDYCGMFPVVGERYRCKDCAEQIGFDLCGECYNTPSKRPGRFNQQHTSDHEFELVNKPNVFQNILFQLVGGHLVDRTGASVLAISAMENSPDGWIAVESALAPSDGSYESAQDFSIPQLESTNNELDISGNNVASPRDENPEQNDHGSQSSE